MKIVYFFELWHKVNKQEKIDLSKQEKTLQINESIKILLPTIILDFFECFCSRIAMNAIFCDQHKTG